MSNIFAFAKGDVVVAERTTQGLKKDEQYTVKEVATQATPFGYFVTYFLASVANPDTALLPIVNGHMILRKEI